MTQYWIGVACKEHVQNGMKEGVAQVCHGKPGPLKRMKEGDCIIYYSPTLTFKGKEACQSFTAIATIKASDPYPFEMCENFIPWRRDVSFLKSKEVLIHPILDNLSFIKNKQKWGFPFRRGCFEISQEDFQCIAIAMGSCS